MSISESSIPSAEAQKAEDAELRRILAALDPRNQRLITATRRWLRKWLPDPAKLLRGSGKQTRWITLEGASTLARPEVLALIDEALARNPVPFAPSGRGSVIIRSAAGK